MKYLIDKLKIFYIYYSYKCLIISKIEIKEDLPENIINIHIIDENDFLLVLKENTNSKDFIICINNYEVFDYDLHFLINTFVLFQFNSLFFKNSLLIVYENIL